MRICLICRHGKIPDDFDYICLNCHNWMVKALYDRKKPNIFKAMWKLVNPVPRNKNV